MTRNKIYLMRPFVGIEELEAVKTVFESKYLTEGPVTQEFEKQFAAFVGAEHGIAVTSCMTGLVLALNALDIGKGDEVIVPDFTHPATGDCVYQAGADAVLVDVDLSHTSHLQRSRKHHRPHEVHHPRILGRKSD